MPFFSGMGMVLRPAIKQLGYNSANPPDPVKLARAAILSSKLFGFDSLWSLSTCAGNPRHRQRHQPL